MLSDQHGFILMKKLKVHYFQHIAQEGFGSCYAYLKALGAEITATEFFALPPDFPLDIEALPQIDHVDLLIIMGGKMSVNDEENYAWLKVEKRWIRHYLAAEKAAIGLCLGGQLIASALGATVKKNQSPEVGWTTIYASKNIPLDYFMLPQKFRVMQWHEETFELPKGAVRLAENSACVNQVYQIGKKVLAFQFHPEITKTAVKIFIEQAQDQGAVSKADELLFEALEKTKEKEFYEGNQILKSAINYVLGMGLPQRSGHIV